MNSFFIKKEYPPFTIMKMPALSPTMTQGNLGEWAKKPGDEIAPGDILTEIETDKATMDFECQEEGFIAKFLVPSHSKEVQVNTVILLIFHLINLISQLLSLWKIRKMQVNLLIL